MAAGKSTAAPAKSFYPPSKVQLLEAKENHEVHAKYVHRFYNKQWDEASNFDLVLDMGSLSYEEAVKRIVQASQALGQKAHPQGVITAASLEVDPVLAAAVAKAIASPLPQVHV